MNVILGLGQTGFSMLKYLAGEYVTVMDTRENPPYLGAAREAYPDTHIMTGMIDEALLQEADEIFVSPGLCIHDPLIKPYQNKMFGDIELFMRSTNQPVIAITGTNGKTTTTTLVGDMLKASGVNVAVGGNIGTSALDLPKADVYVLELSSFQLAVTKTLNFFASVVLNIEPDHLDWHQSFDEYKACKLKVYHQAKHCVYTDEAVRFLDSELQKQFSTRNDSRVGVVTTGFQNEPERLLDSELQKQFFTRNDSGVGVISTEQNMQSVISTERSEWRDLSPLEKNKKVAAELAKLAGATDAAIHSVLDHFKGLPHRCEFVCETEGVSWYNDSKATNISATEAALGQFKKSKQLVLIAGGVAKSDLSVLKKSFDESVHELIVFGESADEFKAFYPAAICVKNLNDAVNKAIELAMPGAVVLLSPACASFDGFKNFEDRGSQFKKLVRSTCVQPAK